MDVGYTQYLPMVPQLTMLMWQNDVQCEETRKRRPLPGGDVQNSFSMSTILQANANAVPPQPMGLNTWPKVLMLSERLIGHLDHEAQ